MDDEMSHQQSGKHRALGNEIYPDLDDTVHYPWRDSQAPAADPPATSPMIDPRLYQDFPTGSSSRLPAQGPEYDEDDLSADAMEADDPSDEESYDSAEYETQSETEVSDVAEQDGDGVDDEYSRRRRHRQGTGPFSGRYGARGGRGVKRGPRKPLEPSPEFKMLHSEATSAFIDGDYDRAADLVKRAIQINPEMFAAHSLLSEIFLAQGQKDKALTALFSGAHTRPRDSTVWAKVARLILERAGEDRQTALNDVIYCYSRVIEIDPKNYNVRFQRAAIYRELGHNGKAASEYERILRERPHNPRALRHLAETYIDLDEVPKALEQYAQSVAYYLSRDVADITDFTWSDVNIYSELFSYLGEHENGMRALKSLSRWMLGRKDDVMWEQFQDDDREWDADDAPRRIKIDGYVPGKWPRDSYGLGLPLELRIKLGLFRLRMGYNHKNEALHHFEWLNPEDTGEGARLYDYGDLFREVADALKEVGLFEEALRFYRPVQQTPEFADVNYFLAMGECCMQLGQLEDAENCYLTVAEHDTLNIDVRVRLAKLYESIGMTEQAFKYVNEAALLGRQESRSQRRRRDTRLEQLAREFRSAELGPETVPPAPTTGTKPVPVEGILTSVPSAAPGRRRAEEEVAEVDRTGHIQFLHMKMLQLQPRVKQGDPDATEDWLDIADALLRDFRSNRVFYPLQRHMVFAGYSRGARKKTGQKTKDETLMDEVHEMAGRLQETIAPSEPPPSSIPQDYHGITFDEWLDMFLQYALLVAGQNEVEEAYDSLAAAAEASVWYHSKSATRLIHVCWFTCALRAQDEDTLTNEARWFIKEYQFVTDTYRLFATLSRLCGDPRRSLFHSSPNMKFMLRQIKAMDYTVPDNDPLYVKRMRKTRESIYRERASLTSRDETGQAIPAGDLDIALLVLYGHILYSGSSFYPALNYFFRAYALDDQNPCVLLSIALCYIHQSLKRQSDNRHYLIMQGLSFMDEYRRVREREGTLLQERQEMEFNYARVWHTLGLSHLAVEGYRRVLAIGAEVQQIQRTTHRRQELASAQQQARTGMEEESAKAISPPQLSSVVEDFSPEAALALQTIHALNGDLTTARAITEKWLVI